MVETVVLARLLRGKYTWEWVVSCCPYCGKEHRHGGGRLDDDPRRLLGHRLSHCLNHAGSEAGYVLTPEDAREDLREMREKERPYPDVEIERAALPVADYSLSGWTEHVGIERKELNDLISCLMNGNRDRFEREFVNFDSTSWRP